MPTQEIEDAGLDVNLDRKVDGKTMLRLKYLVVGDKHQDVSGFSLKDANGGFPMFEDKEAEGEEIDS